MGQGGLVRTRRGARHPRARHPDRGPTVALCVVLALIAWGCAPAPEGRAEGTEPSAPTTTATTGAAPAEATEASPSTTATPPPTELTLAFAGDLLPHLAVVEVAQRNGAGTGTPFDFRPMLVPMAPVLDQVDLALCHLEAPLVADGQAIAGYPTFHSPRELADAVRGAGYDGCSTASNHSLDGGMAGISATLDTFDAVGLGHAGTARSAEEASGPTLYEVHGARIAHLSYTYGFNGASLPDGAPWAVDAIDPAQVATDAAAARAVGAQLVVVSLHWGDEYRSDPSADQEQVAAEVAANPDIDLIVGHHAHVVQPIERVGDTWVVYGLGNQLANQPEVPRSDGLTVVVSVAGPAGGPLAVEGIEAVPTWVDPDTFAVVPLAESLADPDLTAERRDLFEASAARTMEVVNRRGADVAVRAWS